MVEKMLLGGKPSTKLRFVFNACHKNSEECSAVREVLTEKNAGLRKDAPSCFKFENENFLKVQCYGTYVE